MVVEPLASDSGVMLAVAVRDLARDAHRVVSSEFGTEEEASEVLERIDRLRERYGDRPEAPLARWLESLRQRVEAV